MKTFRLISLVLLPTVLMLGASTTGTPAPLNPTVELPSPTSTVLPPTATPIQEASPTLLPTPIPVVDCSPENPSPF